MRNLPFLIRQGFRGVFKHIGSSLFSLSIMVFTIFLFCGAAAIMMNINRFVRDAEENVGITVFFEEGTSSEQIAEIGSQLEAHPAVRRIRFTSAEEAWENYKKIYFAGNEHLADGYAEDNPLANSASYEIFLRDVSRQQEFVSFASEIPGVRRVNHSNAVAEGLSSVESLLQAATIVILAVLLVVAVSLISNSIAITISMRSEEIRIMRYIGATNGFIRGPLMIEGALIGLVGAAIPLLAVWFGYPAVVDHIRERYVYAANLFSFLSREEIFALIAPVAVVLALGIGLLGSMLSIKRHLKA